MVGALVYRERMALSLRQEAAGARCCRTRNGDRVKLVDDAIEHAINRSAFTLRLDGEQGTVVIPGSLIDELDGNTYTVPGDCPWLEPMAD